MSGGKLPSALDEDQIRRMLARYENQKPEEAAAEDAAPITGAETVMNVPRNLVQIVRELIARRRR